MKALKLQGRSSEEKGKGKEREMDKGRGKGKGKSDLAARTGSDEEEDAGGDRLQADGGKGACPKTQPCYWLPLSTEPQPHSCSFCGERCWETPDGPEGQGQGDVPDLG